MPAHRPVLVLANPAAGSAEQDRLDEVCCALSSRVPAGMEVRTPGSDRDYTEVVAGTAGRDVVVLGGDGSVHRLLQELSAQGLLEKFGAVGVVPMGTGNDLARGEGLRLRWQDAVPVAVGGRPSRRGLLVDDDGGVVVNVVHAGVAAEATAYASEVKGLLGRTAYAVGALRAGLTSRGWHLRVVVDGRPVADGSDRVLMVSVALGPSVGGGTPIAPQARPDDGLVDVVVAHATSPGARVGFARDLRRGRHTDRADVTTVRGADVLVEAVGPEDAFRVNTDGDVADDRLTARRWRFSPQAWTLRTPSG